MSLSICSFKHSFTSINSLWCQAIVDPIAWKTELERVGPKLRAQQQLSTNEWRAHVDQTVANNQHIEKVLEETQSDLQIMNKYVLVYVEYKLFSFCWLESRSLFYSNISLYYNLLRTVSEDLNKMRTKEKYMNNQYASLCAEYEQVLMKLLSFH